MEKLKKELSILRLNDEELPNQFHLTGDKYLVTEGKSKFPFQSKGGLIIKLTKDHLILALYYFCKKAISEIKVFLKVDIYNNISVEKNGALYYSGRVLPSQQLDNKLHLSDVCLDLSMAFFCVPLIDKHSPIFYAIINENHWYDEERMPSIPGMKP